MAWRSLHPKHAIERVRISFEFKESLPTKVVRQLSVMVDEYRDDLGFSIKSDRLTKQFLINPTAKAVVNEPDKISGWEIKRITSKNDSVEALIVEHNTLVYEVVEYDRWVGFIERFQEVALTILDKAMETSDIDKVTLEYIDRFVFDGKTSKAVPSELLIGVPEMLHEDAQSGERLWHLHRGWFEQDNGILLLVNQNIDAQEGRLGSRPPMRSVQILTKVEQRGIQSEVDFQQLKPQLEVMHNRSKSIFASILIPEMRKSVGISTGE